MNPPNTSNIMNQFTSRLKQTIGGKKGERKQQLYYPEFSFQNICKNVNFEQQAKDDFGNLHPHYAEPVKKGYEAVNDYVELYTHDILNAVREIDLLCIKTCNRNYDNYEKCKAETNEEIRRKIYIPIVNSSAFLYKISNLCLLKGNNIDICANIITEHTYFMFKLAAQRAKILTRPLQKLVPIELQLPVLRNEKLNNAIDD